ncbi:MAG TPA: homoserine acetyltransferase [Flavobacteriaceae bacterium]|jgi:homoserine O-acetyltransferase|nr:homoserine acetyltransferase [Flavobacteriaceae bacterium]HBS11380.1 homoserine acetyltransferase [Flavobacteriaceae bacterium]
MSLEYIEIQNFKTEFGKAVTIRLSYQIFGKPLGEAPIVLVNHALTGNSTVCGKDGWWQDLIGDGKCIDTNQYTVLAFDIPGNGFGNDAHFIDNYKDFTARDIAKIFVLGLEALKIKSLYAVIGGSVGGGIAWELAVLKPNYIEYLIPIASDWKSTDWLIANCYLQDLILNNSSSPIADARVHAMLCYRTPASFKTKFDRSTNKSLDVFNIESWLIHHGKKLNERFHLATYKLMNQLLKTIDITRDRGGFEEVASTITSHIHIVGVNTDLFFTVNENKDTFEQLKNKGLKVSYDEVESIHGHDAFLIEYKQLTKFLNPIFKNKIKKVA